MNPLVIRLLTAGFGGSAAAGALSYIAVEDAFSGFSGTLADFGAVGALVLVARFAYKSLTSLSATLQAGLSEASTRAVASNVRADLAEQELRRALEEVSRLRGVVLMHGLDPDKGAS